MRTPVARLLHLLHLRRLRLRPLLRQKRARSTREPQKGAIASANVIIELSTGADGSGLDLNQK